MHIYKYIHMYMYTYMCIYIYIYIYILCECAINYVTIYYMKWSLRPEVTGDLLI